MMVCKRKLMLSSDSAESDEYLHNCDEYLEHIRPRYDEILSESEFESETDKNKSTRGPLPTPEKCIKGRKKKQNMKKIDLNKKMRNEGRQYLAIKTGKAVPPAKVGNPCRCPLKCFELEEHDISSIFNGFWDIGDFDKQNAYLFGCIDVIPVKRRYKKKENQPSYKQNTFTYKVRVNGQSRRICKKMFMSIHGLHKHRGRLNNIIKCIRCKLTTPPLDRRGKHENRYNRVPRETIDGVH